MNQVLEMETQKDRTPVVQQSTALVTTPADLLRIAVAGGADLDRLEKLMELQERWDANQARKAFVEAMTEFKKNPPEIFKQKLVKFGTTEYMHATIGDVTSAVIEGLARHGISHRWKPSQQGGMIAVECILTHSMGHSEATRLEAAPDGSGGKNSIQAVMSAKTYLERHTLLAACGLATKDLPDDDGAGAGARAGQEKPKHVLNEGGLDKAIAAIQAGDYTYKQLITKYELTEKQLQKAKDLLKVAA